MTGNPEYWRWEFLARFGYRWPSLTIDSTTALLLTLVFSATASLNQITVGPVVFWLMTFAFSFDITAAGADVVSWAGATRYVRAVLLLYAVSAVLASIFRADLFDPPGSRFWLFQIPSEVHYLIALFIVIFALGVPDRESDTATGALYLAGRIGG